MVPYGRAGAGFSLIDVSYTSETRRKDWLKHLAQKLTPISNVRAYNYGLLDVSRRICTLNDPKCSECPLLKFCETGNSIIER